LAWAPFYLLTFFTALPGLLLCWWMRPTLDALSAKRAETK
jgi:hypothetical protein